MRTRFFIEVLETPSGMIVQSFMKVSCVEIRLERVECRKEEKTIALDALLENIEQNNGVKRDAVEIHFPEPANG
jgi:hypothetical protein